jgi:peptide/nickel transport system permease protein
MLEVGDIVHLEVDVPSAGVAPLAQQVCQLRGCSPGYPMVAVIPPDATRRRSPHHFWSVAAAADDEPSREDNGAGVAFSLVASVSDPVEKPTGLRHRDEGRIVLGGESGRQAWRPMQSGATDDDRWHRQLSGLGQTRAIGHAVVPTAEAERLPGRRLPQPRNDGQLLLQPIETLFHRGEGYALDLVLELHPARAKAEGDPSTAHGVDLGHNDGEGNRRAERGTGDEGAKADGRGVTRQAGKRGPSVRRPGESPRWTDFGGHAQIMIRAVDALEPIARRGRGEGQNLLVTSSLLRLDAHTDSHEANNTGSAGDVIMAVSTPYEPTIAVRGLARLHDRLSGVRPLSVPNWIAIAVPIAVTIFAILVPEFAPHNPDLPIASPFMPPSRAYWFGTDDVGRDIFSRVLFGFRTSWFASLVVVSVALAIGAIVGLLAGGVGKILDTVLMRVTDLFLALPGPLLAIALVAALGPSLEHTLIAVLIVWWPFYARVIRGEIRSLAARPHLEAARLADAGQFRLLWRHLLPGAVPVMVVTASLDMGNVVLILAGLSFLGLGAPAPSPELGSMAAEGLTYLLVQWWVGVLPAAAVCVIAFTWNLTGDGLRNILVDR